MSHWKKIVLSPYFAATTGATALALTLGAANAQNLPVPTPSAPAPSDATAPLPTPVPANPNPLGIGAPTAATPNVPASTTLQLGAASNAASAPLGAAANVETLRAQARTLEGRLRQAPTTAAEQEEQLKIVAELSALQRQIQQAEAAAGDFASYRRTRAAQEGVDLDAALDANLNANPLADPGAVPALGGLPGGSGSNASPTAAIPLAPGEAELLRAQKEELTRQYRQLQQTMRALSPSDEALATTLRAEQTTLLNQLKEIDERLTSAPAAPAFPNALPNLGGDFANAIPPENRLPAFAGASELTDGNDVAAKMQKAQEAAEILRSVGLVNLAGLAAAEIPRLADPNFAETRYVPGTWTEGAGLAEERYNPFQQISKDEIDAIKTSIDDLKTRVDSLTEIMSNVETQLKLLTRQTVDAASPVAPVVPTPETPAPSTDVPEAPLAE